MYMPRGVKNGYFGLFSLLGFNLAGLDNRRGLEMVLCMTLLILLDKSADTSAAGWFQPIKRNTPTTTDLSAKEQQRLERENELKLQQLLERDLRRSQKQIVHDDQIKSASNSPSHSPQVSPVPTPTVSTDYKSSLRHSIKHLDATATLQLPNAAAAPYASLESLFAPIPPHTQQQSISSAAAPPATTTTTTTAAAVPGPVSASSHHHRHHQQHQQLPQPSYAAVHDPRSYYYYYSNTDAIQQPLPNSARHSNTAQRPRSYRRLSTDDQIMQYYQPSMRAYHPSSGLIPSQQEHQQQRYSNASDYYYMYR
ncbi:hypothetical protein BX666DRAFT_359869 [Dichotomocladium elegans]|nr:hypothetical protein BX666DRAFT_359869 [Dichotomocladium elegans]